MGTIESNYKKIYIITFVDLNNAVFLCIIVISTIITDPPQIALLSHIILLMLHIF